MARRSHLQHRHLQLGGPRPSEQERLLPRPHEAHPAGWRSGCRRKGPQVGGFILSQVPSSRCRQDLAPHPPRRPQGRKLLAPSSPWRLRASHKDEEQSPAPGAGATGPSPCGQCLPPSLRGFSSTSVRCPSGPSFEGPCDNIGLLDNPGLPPTLASFVTSANTLLLCNSTFTGSWGWDPLSSGAKSRLSRLSRSPTKAGPQNPRLTKSQTLNVPCSAAIFQFNWLEMDLAGRDIPGNRWV